MNRNGGEVDGVGRQRGGVGEGLKGEKGRETECKIKKINRNFMFRKTVQGGYVL